MTPEFLPDFVTTFLESLTTPEFWERVSGIGLTLILILVFFRILQFIVSRTVRKHMPEARTVLIRKTIRYIGYVVAAATVLKGAGLDLSALLGAAGIAGIAIGFAAQTSISNFISGLFLISEKPFKIGDVIQTGDITGIVMSIDLLSVKLQTFDNRFVRIPNETIIKTNVINTTRFPIRRMDIWLSVAYNSDLDEVRAVLKDVAARNLHVLDNPEPLILIDKFDVSGVSILFGVWYELSKFMDLKNSLITDIHRRFSEEGIEIPYPKMNVYLKEGGNIREREENT